MTILVGLGSNLGRRRPTLETALREIERRGVHVDARSGLYESAPVGIPSQRPFLNAVVRVTWQDSPDELLAALREVETACGRRRDHPAGDRTCDLDLLLFHDRICAGDTLTLPHPRMGGRRFVLEPLLDLEPDLTDPSTGEAYANALLRTRRQACVRLCGPDGWA